MGKLENRVALITGGVSGLGRACAQRFIEEGASVVLADINSEKGKAAEADLSSLGGDVLFLEIDVTDELSQTRVFEEIVSRFSKLDVVVAAAGISSANYVSGQVNERSEDPEANFLFNKSVDHWRKVLEVNLTGVMLTNQLAIRSMIGRLVFGSASRSGHRGMLSSLGVPFFECVGRGGRLTAHGSRVAATTTIHVPARMPQSCLRARVRSEVTRHTAHARRPACSTRVFPIGTSRAETRERQKEIPG